MHNAQRKRDKLLPVRNELKQAAVNFIRPPVRSVMSSCMEPVVIGTLMPEINAPLKEAFRSPLFLSFYKRISRDICVQFIYNLILFNVHFRFTRGLIDIDEEIKPGVSNFYNFRRKGYKLMKYFLFRENDRWLQNELHLLR